MAQSQDNKSASVDDDLELSEDLDLASLNTRMMKLIMTPGYMDTLLRAIAYQPAFDAVAMRRKIISTIIRVKPPRERERIQKDLFCLCSIGLNQGNNLVQISKFIKGEFRSVFMTFKGPLELVSKTGGNGDAVTMLRIISCFPEVAVTVLNQPRYPMLIPYESLKEIYEEFPLVARHQVCASIIDTSLPRDQIAKIMDVIMVPYMLMTNRIDRNKVEWTSKDRKTQFRENFTYLQRFFESEILNEASRRAKCITYKIINETGNITTTWEAASAECKEWLIDNYGCSSSDHIGSWGVDGSIDIL